MYNLLLANRNGSQGKIKIIPLIILIFLFVSSFSAEASIVATINHECVGDGCPICEHVQKMKALDALIDEMIATAFVVLLLAACLFSIVTAPVKNIILSVKSATLVGKMVRMNN